MVDPSEIDIEQLKTEIDNTSDYKIKYRLLLVINYLRGFSGPEIAEIFNISADQVYFWINRYEEGGVTELHDKKRSGRPRKLDYSDLENALRQSPSHFGIDASEWDISTIHQYIRDHQKVDISKKYLYEVLSELEYSVNDDETRIKDDEIQTFPDLRTKSGKMFSSLHLEVMYDAQVKLDAPIHKIITKSGIKPVLRVIKSDKHLTVLQGEAENGILTIKYEEFPN